MIWRVEFFEDAAQTSRTRLAYVRASSQDDAAKIASEHMQKGEMSAALAPVVFGSGIEPGPMLSPKLE